MSHRPILLLGVLALCGLLTPPVVADPSPPETSPAVQSTSPATQDTITTTYTVSLLPEQPSRIAVNLTTTAPAGVTTVTLHSPPANLTVQSMHGYTREGQRFVWRNVAADTTATLNYTVPANITHRDGSGYRMYATGQWAYVRLNFLDFGHRYSTQEPTIRVAERLTHRGEGYSGVHFAYLGPHTVTQTVNFTVVRPQRASLRSSQQAVATGLEAASRQFDGGKSAPDHVNVFIAPDPIRGGGLTPFRRVAGVQDVTVHAQSKLNGPHNVWFHEYVHTQQTYRTAPGLRWLREGSASYHAALFAYQQSRISFDRFYRYVNMTGPDADAVLAARHTWDSDRTPYRKGRHVVAALDARIRQSTGGERSYADVFRRLNARDDRVNLTEFKQVVVAVSGNESLAGWVDQYVNSSAIPPLPDNASLYSPPQGVGDRATPATSRAPIDGQSATSSQTTVGPVDGGGRPLVALVVGLAVAIGALAYRY